MGGRVVRALAATTVALAVATLLVALFLRQDLAIVKLSALALLTVSALFVGAVVARARSAARHDAR